MNHAIQNSVGRTALVAATFALAVFAASSLAAATITPNPSRLEVLVAQDGENNPAEFTLTSFSDAARGWNFMRPSSWTQDLSFKDGVRFAGGDEWLEWRVVNTALSPQAYASKLALPKTETKVGIKAVKQGRLDAQVISSKTTGKSNVTAKPLELLTDRWVFSPASGKLAVLTVTGPSKVFDWEGNRDMALSLRVK